MPAFWWKPRGLSSGTEAQPATIAAVHVTRQRAAPAPKWRHRRHSFARERGQHLAHLLRNVTYASEDGDGGIAPGFRLLLLQAMAIGKRRGAEGQHLGAVPCGLGATAGPAAVRANAGPACCTPPVPRHAPRPRRSVPLRHSTPLPYTNIAFERTLRPAMIFRKVTGGLRAEQGAKVHAAAASVIAIRWLHKRTAFGALRAALAGEAVMRTA